ncbi:hypothetical protein AZE42_08434 [Rhizopogon vesiculosus]|uniref:Cytochrome P450 n=1 Tax=Rhizopogon vesiculosus TaxID=180088 RepID=A0A1J8QFE8_9AGAM|nr:hypothetical protein AZE42_08434 [Rhizopogon vesiculosus]
MGSGTYLVESIPWLKYLPWYGRELKHEYESIKRLNTSQLNHVKQQMQSNVDVGPSFAKYMLDNGQRYGLTELEMASLAGVFFGGGSDTVSAAIGTVLMAAACFPEEQAKVQAEFDEAIGRDRVMKVAYGKNTPTAATDPEVIEVRRIMAISRTVMGSGTYLVESIPWLKYLPWYGQELKRGYESVNRLNISRLNHVKQQMQSNVDVGPSFVKYVLENVHRYGLTELEMASLAGTFFSSGSDTVFVAIGTVLMAAACFPEEQAKVQAELDEVIGRHRCSSTPSFAMLSIQ